MIDEFEFFLEKHWSDGFPVVTPTEERLQRVLRGTARDPEEVVGHIPPVAEPATVRTVAIHALMAGCKPEYLPVVLGGIEIMLREEFNLNGVQGTMHGVAPLMIVNGPYAQKIGLHGGNGCFGPGFRANASIGRAIRLMLMNLGGGIAGVGSATVFGTPLRYTACVTENVERTPWLTLAASRGYSNEDDVITCAMVESPRLCYDDANQEPERLLTGIADSMTALGSWNMHVRSDMVVAMSPEHATVCSKAGLSREDVHRKLIEMAGLAVRDMKRGGNWRRERAQKLGIDPEDEARFVPVIKDPRDLHLIVAGGWGPLDRGVSRVGWGLTLSPWKIHNVIDEFEFFLDKHWSDGLPVVTPTEARLAKMLQATDRDPEELVGNVPPAMEPATVRTVVIHALMAGCKPEYLPVVLGALKLMLRDEFNMNGVQGTMHGVAPLMIVNGPYAQKIGIHGGNGCFGPSFRANATIGRAIRLMMLNLGGGIAGIGSATIFATPMRYTACIGENVERSPWETLAQSKGYGADENVITCAMVESPRLCFDDVSQEPQRLLNGVADSMVAMGSWNMHAQSDMVVAMGPQHATICAKGGMSRADVHRRLCELAGRKVRDLKDGGNWRRERALQFPIEVDPDDDDCFIPAIKDPKDLQLLVAGGWGPCTAVCHGWSGGSRAVAGTYRCPEVTA